MLTTRKWATVFSWIGGGLAALFVCGCAPPGVRALLKGEQELRARDYVEAVKRLTTATRLLPRNAQAWNHLGLAYHYQGQWREALQAYQVAVDRDSKLASARFNLGSLLLEQRSYGPAITELTAYVALAPRSSVGWAKLGTAYFHSGNMEEAIRAYEAALQLDPASAEALNGLGVIAVQRKRPQEGWRYFNEAIGVASNYPPAVLNLGVLAHQHMRNPELALVKYREYLSLSSASRSMTPAVRALAHDLAVELNPPPAPELTNALPARGAPPPDIAVLPPQDGTNRVQQSGLATPPGVAETNRNVEAVGPEIQSAQHTTNALMAASSNALPVVPSVPRTNAQATGLVSPPDPSAEAPPSMTNQSVQIDPIPLDGEIKVVELPVEFAPRVAQDETVPADQLPAETDAAPRMPPPRDMSPPKGTEAGSERIEPAPPEEKRSFVQRMNPMTWFRGKKKSEALERTPLPAEGMERDVPQKQDAPVEPEATPVETPPPAAPPPRPKPEFPRYTYSGKTRPAPGNRPKAETYFNQGLSAQREYRLRDAIDFYRRATELDPAYFEAHYNLGLAAYEVQDWALSLSSYEKALSTKETSKNARFNFALALLKADYVIDAAAELEKLLEVYPEEVRAHFTVANIYAQKLERPELAVPHYRRVMDLEPDHPQAAAVRYWLLMHP